MRPDNQTGTLPSRAEMRLRTRRAIRSRLGNLLREIQSVQDAARDPNYLLDISQDGDAALTDAREALRKVIDELRD